MTDLSLEVQQPLPVTLGKSCWTSGAAQRVLENPSPSSLGSFCCGVMGLDHWISILLFSQSLPINFYHRQEIRDLNVENVLFSSCLQYPLVYQAMMLFLQCVSIARLLGARLGSCKRRGGSGVPCLRTVWWEQPAGWAQPWCQPWQVPVWFLKHFCTRCPRIPAFCMWGTELAPSGTTATCTLCSELCLRGKNNMNLKPCGMQVRNCLHLTADLLS